MAVLINKAKAQTAGGQMQSGTLSDNQKKQIQSLQDAWAKANETGDQNGMDTAHAEAERIRASAGFSGGADGSQHVSLPRQQKSVLNGGYTADDVQQYVNAFKAANSDELTYYNGYSPDMNMRSMANYIRQQMKANSDAWQDASDTQRQYLHSQNQELAKILSSAAGGVQSRFNEQLGRWETDNADLGYGYYTGGYNDSDWYKNAYGMTDEQAEKYRSDTDRYYNFVDQSLVRNWVDESGGFTGKYAQFVNGPYPQWMTAGALGRPNIATYADVIGDGFGREGDAALSPVTDEAGNIVPQAPLLKGGNVNSYTRGKAAYVENGVIMPGMLDRRRVQNGEQNMWINGGNPVADTGENYGVRQYNTLMRGSLGGGGVPAVLGSSADANSYEAQINQMYDAQLRAQIAQLEAAYNQSIADLDLSLAENDAQAMEQRRQTTGAAQQQAAAFREIANAQGYNSGAIGQAALADAGQLQGDLNAINSAQATAQAEIERQRALAAQSYSAQIQQAQADNDYARVQALLQEAQRVDDALREQAQFQSQQALNYAQMFMSNATA